ncbi:hypothetical protein NKI32_26215 [Mesorhizobium sp. M0761]
MDGNVITSRRTAATAALGARFLARLDARSILVIGAGRVGSLIPDAYLAVRPVEKVSVWDIQHESADKLTRSLNERGITAQVVTDLEQAGGAADIVTAATLAPEPVIKGQWIRKGTHIALIGAFTPESEGGRRCSVDDGQGVCRSARNRCTRRVNSFSP